MELIKKIKQAETQAQDIIAKAKADAAKQADEGRRKRQAVTEAAEQERKEAIDSAAGQAKAQGQAEVAVLQTDSEAKRRQLRDRTKAKMPGAVEKVVNYLKG
ncbi:MAG: hypothetical protein ISS79_06065 [Phycisphaerae bacterium]|nr:hypothetical protein [Phycisphaerae bacterium]